MGKIRASQVEAVTKTQRQMIRNEMIGIRNAIRELKKGAFIDIATSLSAHMLPSRLFDIKDSEGFNKVYRCNGIPGGVRITSDGGFKITAVREVQNSESR